MNRWASIYTIIATVGVVPVVALVSFSVLRDDWALLGAAAQTLAAFVIAGLTVAVVRANHEMTLLHERAAEMQTAKLKIVAGGWSGNDANLYIVNSGWKPSAIEQAWIRLESEGGGGPRFRLQLSRVYGGDDDRYNLLVPPGERIRIRGIPLNFHEDQVPPGHISRWVELKPVLGEVPPPVDLMATSFPRE